MSEGRENIFPTDTQRRRLYVVNVLFLRASLMSMRWASSTFDEMRPC